MIDFMLLISRQGKVRLAKWYTTLPTKAKAQIVRDLTQIILARRPRMCNVLEYKGMSLLHIWRLCTNSPRADRRHVHILGRKVIYRRYASLFFVCGIGENDNELVTLEIIHRYVEVLDRYFGSVCEMDLIFNFQKAYSILDELIVAGELQDSSKTNVQTLIQQVDMYEANEVTTEALHEMLYA